MRVIVNGANGRMGRAVIEGLKARGDEFVAVDVFGEAAFKSVSECDVPADVLIDFSSPAALSELLRYAGEKQVPLVLATTGYSDAQIAEIEAAAKDAAVFRSANMSLGINLLKKLIQTAAKVLGDDFDCEIVETHHNQKKDAPSGTAILLYDALKEAYAAPREMVAGRHGADCKREPREIGVHAVRGGTVPGIHEVGFFGNNEVLTLSHSAQRREVFAQGALKAAVFMQGKKQGLYDMDTLLGDK